jgi:CysZ protein
VTNSLTPTRAPGFLDGVGCFVGSVRFVLSEPTVWRLAVVPVVNYVSAFVYLAYGGVAWILHDVQDTGTRTKREILSEWLHANAGTEWVTPAFAVLLGTIAVVHAVSASSLDAVARKHLFTQRVWEFNHWSDAVLRAAESTMTSLIVALPVIVVLSRFTTRHPSTWQLTAIAAAVVCGLALAWNFVEYPLCERELDTSQRVRFMFRHYDAMAGFGLAAAVFMLIPVLGLLILPAGVVGGARLIVGCDRAERAGLTRAA